MQATRVFLLLVSIGSVSSTSGPPAWPRRAVSFWYDATNASTQYDPADGHAMLEKVNANRNAITSVILHCGLQVGAGGEVVGNVSAACANTVIPGLLALGVKVEMMVQSGTNDIKDYRKLFSADPASLAARLVALGKTHGLAGWNFDLEPQVGKPSSTGADAAAYQSFGASLLPALHAAGLRLTADLGLSGKCDSMTGPCPGLMKGYDRLMNMGTYNAKALAPWTAVAQSWNAVFGDSLSTGLGCWTDSTTCTGCPNVTKQFGPWSLSPESAAERVCWAMNASVPELSFWVLTGLAPSPHDFWWPQLGRYLAGGGCAV